MTTRARYVHALGVARIIDAFEGADIHQLGHALAAFRKARKGYVKEYQCVPLVEAAIEKHR